MQRAATARLHRGSTLIHRKPVPRIFSTVLSQSEEEAYRREALERSPSASSLNEAQRLHRWSSVRQNFMSSGSDRQAGTRVASRRNSAPEGEGTEKLSSGREGKEWATRVTIIDDLPARNRTFPLIFFHPFSSSFSLLARLFLPRINPRVTPSRLIYHPLLPTFSYPSTSRSRIPSLLSLSFPALLPRSFARQVTGPHLIQLLMIVVIYSA